MEITAQRICGDTWCVIEPKAIVPYYRLNEKEIILLDSGCLLQGELEAWLAEQKLHVKAILTTHDHWDHVAAHQALQQVHGAKIYLPKIEAALHATDLGHLTAHANGNLKKFTIFLNLFLTVWTRKSDWRTVCSMFVAYPFPWCIRRGTP